MEGKLKLELGSELRKGHVTGEKEEMGRITKRSCESLAMTEASHEIAKALDKKGKVSLTEKELPSLVS